MENGTSWVNWIAYAAIVVFLLFLLMLSVRSLLIFSLLLLPPVGRALHRVLPARWRSKDGGA